MMKTYKEIETRNDGLKVIHWFEESGGVKSSGAIVEGRTETRTNEDGETETYSPYDGLIESGVEIEWITDEQKTAEAKEQARNQAKRERDAALQALTYTTAAGDVIQCREVDEIRLRRQLARMEADGTEAAPWIAADNRLVSVTPDDLRGALRHGEDEVARIFAEYMEATL